MMKKLLNMFAIISVLMSSSVFAGVRQDISPWEMVFQENGRAIVAGLGAMVFGFMAYQRYKNHKENQEIYEKLWNVTHVHQAYSRERKKSYGGMPETIFGELETKPHTVQIPEKEQWYAYITEKFKNGKSVPLLVRVGGMKHGILPNDQMYEKIPNVMLKYQAK